MTTAILAALPTAPLPAGSRILTAILGQSQMEGNGAFASDVPNAPWDDVPSYARIWNKCVLPTRHDPIDDGAWVPLTPGFGRSGPDSMGPEIELAYKLHQHYGVDVDIVKCTRGSTALSLAGTPVNWNPKATGTAALFDIFKTYYWGPALAALEAEIGRSSIYCPGVCWFQGAADSTGSGALAGAAAEYRDNLEALHFALASILGPEFGLTVTRSENFHESPVSAVANRYPLIETVRGHQEAFVAATPRTVLINCDRRELAPGRWVFDPGPDGEHWDAPPQRQHGQALGAALINLDTMLVGPGGAL